MAAWSRLLFALLVGFAGMAPGVAAPAAVAVAAPSGHPALWEVRKGRARLVLFGTFHALPVGLAWRTAPLDRAVAQANRLVTEVVIGDMKDPATAASLGQLMAQRGFAGPDQKVASGLLTPAQYALLEATVEKQGLPRAAAARMRPWFATLMLTQGMIAQAGYVPELGAERQIAKTFSAAKRHGANLGLETLLQQIGLFADMDEDTAAQALRETLDDDDGDGGAARLRALSDAWATGNDAAIERDMVTESVKRYPQFHKALFTDRNAAWAGKLEGYLQQPGTTLVAVGAGHFYGPGGLIDLLQRRGLKVRRLQ